MRPSSSRYGPDRAAPERPQTWMSRVRAASARAGLAVSAGRRSLWLLAFAVACGGSPTAPPPVAAPREALPELRTLTIAFSDDAPPASRSLSANITAIDHRGQPMSVGLVAWSSSDTSVATIVSDGAILARRQGTTIISASVGDVSTRRNLTVLPLPPGPLPVAMVTVSPLTSTVGVGQSEQLTATLLDFAGRALTDRDVRWVSSDDAIAIVSESGIVIARDQGVTVIEAISEGKRSGAVITVQGMVDTGIVVRIALPITGVAFADSIQMYVTVKSDLPIDSVVAVLAGKLIPLKFVLVSNNSGTAFYPTWQAKLDGSSAPYGPLAIAVTATDSLGRRGVAVVNVARNPMLTPGSKSPPASK